MDIFLYYFVGSDINRMTRGLRPFYRSETFLLIVWYQNMILKFNTLLAVKSKVLSHTLNRLNN